MQTFMFSQIYSETTGTCMQGYTLLNEFSEFFQFLIGFQIMLSFLLIFYTAITLNIGADGSEQTV